MAVLDFLISYYDYRIAKESGTNLGKVQNRRNRVLKLRLQKPAALRKPFGKQDIKAPGNGLKAKNLGMKIGRTDRQSDFFELNVSPFAFGKLDRNRGSLIDSSFKVLDLTLRHENSQTEFKRLDVLSIEKI